MRSAVLEQAGRVRDQVTATLASAGGKWYADLAMHAPLDTLKMAANAVSIPSCDEWSVASLARSSPSLQPAVLGSVKFVNNEKMISIVVAGGVRATGEWSLEYKHGVLGADVSLSCGRSALLGSRSRAGDALVWHGTSSVLQALQNASGVELPPLVQSWTDLGLLMKFVGKLTRCSGASSRLAADVNDVHISEALLSGVVLAPRVVGAAAAVCESNCVGVFVQGTPKPHGHVQQHARCRLCIKLRTSGRMRLNKKRKRALKKKEDGKGDGDEEPADKGELRRQLVAAEVLLAQVAEVDAARLPANCIPQVAVVRGMVVGLRVDRMGKQRRYTKKELAFFTDMERRIGSAAYVEIESMLPMPRLRTLQNYKPVGRSLRKFDFMDLLDVLLPRCDRVGLSREAKLSLVRLLLRVGIVGFDGVAGRAHIDINHNLELTGLVEKESEEWIDLTMEDVASKVATEMVTFIWRSAGCGDAKCTLFTVDSTTASSALIGEQLSLALATLRAPPSLQRRKQLVSLGGVALTPAEIGSLHTAFVQGGMELVADGAPAHSKPLADAVAAPDNGVIGEHTDATHAAKRIGNGVRDLKGGIVAYIVLPGPLVGKPELEAEIALTAPMPIGPQPPHGESPNAAVTEPNLTKPEPDVIRFAFDNYAKWSFTQVGGLLSAVRASVSDASPDKWTRMRVPPLLRMLKPERLELFVRDAQWRADRAVAACEAAGAEADAVALAKAAADAKQAAREATKARRVLLWVGESVRALLDRRPLASSQEMLDILSVDKTNTENISALVCLLNTCWQKRRLYMMKVCSWLLPTHALHRSGDAKMCEDTFAEAEGVAAAKVHRIGSTTLASDVLQVIEGYQRVLEQVLQALSELKQCSFSELVDIVSNVIVISPGRWTTDANEGLHLYLRKRAAANRTPTTRDAHAAAASHHAGQVAAAHVAATPVTAAAKLAPESASGPRGNTLPDERQCGQFGVNDVSHSHVTPGSASAVAARKTGRRCSHARSAQAVVVAPVVSRAAAAAEAAQKRTAALPTTTLAAVAAQDAAVLAYLSASRLQRALSLPHSAVLDLNGRNTFVYIAGAAVKSLGKRFRFDGPRICTALTVEAAVKMCSNRSNRAVAEAVVRLVYAMTTAKGSDEDGDHNQLINSREKVPGRLVRFRRSAASTYLAIMSGRLVYECTPSVKPDGESKRRRVYTAQQQCLQRVVESVLMHMLAIRMGAGSLTPDQAKVAHTELVRIIHRKWFKSDVVPALNAEIGAAREERRSRLRKRRRAKANDAKAAAVAAAKNEPAPPKTASKRKLAEKGTLGAPISTANKLMAL